MAFEFVLPDLGEGMTEGEIRKWLVKAGDSVSEHQGVVEIETDKAVIEVPSPKKGKILKLLREEGDVVKVGEALMSIETEEEAGERPSVSVVGALPESAEVLAVPAVRALARELKVDISALKGSGPGGAVTKEDVIAEGKKTPMAEEDIERVPIRGVRRTIAKNLLSVLRTYASVTGMDEADVTELYELREREKAALMQKGVHLTFMPFFIKAVHRALAYHPLFNASVDDEKGEIVIKKRFNAGIATNTPDGLMVPVIRDAGAKTIVDIAGELQGLAEKAKARTLKLQDLKGGTFTLSNYGSFGGTFATPIINYPESAILGTGRIAERPWVRGGRIVIRKILPLSLTFDHRVTDGADAAQFLSRIIKSLEDPASIFAESS